MNMPKKQTVEEVGLQKLEAHPLRPFEAAQSGILLVDAKTGKTIDVHQFLVNMETKEGKNMEVEFVSNVYLMGSQRMIRCNIRNVSERKRIDQLKDDFISTVSHEIRTPLSVLKLGIDNLEISRAMGSGKGEGKIIDALKRNAEKLERLIMGLLDLSRLESGKAGPTPQTVHIGTLIQEAIQGCQDTAKERGIVFQEEYEKDLPPLQADPNLLMRVLTNLLDNALRFAKSTITVKAQKIDSNIQISVTNDGPGIKPEDIPTLFDKYIQVNRPLKGDKYMGTGLGLAICSEIIKLHKGKIWATSTRDEGTRFYFSTPLNGK